MNCKQLVQAAIEHGVSSLALTNINSTCDLWDFVEECEKHDINPVCGAEIRNDDSLCYILLAANNSGLEWINHFLSSHLMDEKEFPLHGHQQFFNDKNDGFVIYPLGSVDASALDDHERIGVEAVEVNKLIQYDVKKYAAKYVVLQPVTYLDKAHYNVHRLLRAIDKNTLLSKLPASSSAGDQEYFFSPSVLINKFKAWPALVSNSYRLLESCSVQIDFKTDKNKKTFSATAEDDQILLAKLAYEGVRSRYGNNKLANERVKKELSIISRMGFNAYFLITWDIIRYAQSRGFYYVGRGSGANSIVAYCLYITDVDPIDLDLYFERFLNPYRTSPPDFDIDFSWTDRDEVIDYVFKRYGKQHVALLGMYSTFQYRAVVRELGKVFGLPKEEIDLLARGEMSDDKIHHLIMRYGELISDFPNHLSIHPGGMLISEAPIARYATSTLPPKGFPTAQLDMFVAENIGLYKLDILSQRGLGHIRECLGLVKRNCGVDINIHQFDKFKNDPNLREQIRTVNTIGCFYIESPAMRQLLLKLKCSDYLTLVAASSIIRPGVSSSGMMKAYIERYHDPSNIDYIHPVMKELLEETYGVMVYQEDVIKVAHHFAGLEMGEADILRRAMSGKYRGNDEMMRIRKKFFDNCDAKGYAPEITAEIWRQIESFGGYSFSKAHSASFAVESYQSLYLKTYYPKEFMIAVINNFGGFYSRELYFLELRKTGAEIHLPCVNNSEYATTIKGNDVYTGFIHMKSLQQELAMQVIEERESHGPFLSLQDFIERINAGPEQLNLLVSIGALRFTGKSKKQLLWETNFLHKKLRHEPAESLPIFKEPPVEFGLPVLKDDRLEDIYDQLEILDFPLCNPFELVDDDPGKYIPARELQNNLGKEITVLGYYITEKPVTTRSNTRMGFATFVDSNLDWLDTVHFPPSLKAYPLKGRGFYKIRGKVTEDFGVYALDVNHLQKIGYKPRKWSQL